MVMHDVSGQTIKAGDTIAMAFRSSTHAHLRVGTVQMVLDDERCLLVEWHAGTYLPSSPVTKVGYDSKRIAVFR